VEPNQIDLPPVPKPAEPGGPQAVAPAWHTILLVAAVLAVSIHGASRFSVQHNPTNRLATYGYTIAMELAMLGWIILGLRLRKTPLRSLLGAFSFNFRALVVDIAFALVFWICSLMVLGTLAIAWSGIEAAVAHGQPASPIGQQPALNASQEKTLRALTQLAPSNGEEIAAWALLCLVAGVVEEISFRGYLQRQFIAWTNGRVTAGVLLSALCFGFAHAYQGLRGIFLIAVFGALFSLLALYRRSLRAGMFAHTWQDFLVGVAIAFFKSHHFF
jgi:membrane protease YdiL (CAAX protease family)